MAVYVSIGFEAIEKVEDLGDQVRVIFSEDGKKYEVIGEDVTADYIHPFVPVNSMVIRGVVKELSEESKD